MAKNTEKKFDLKAWMNTDRFKHGAMARVFIVVFLVAVVLVNVIVGALSERFPSWTRFDLTSASLNSLSEESMAVVKTVDEPTTIYLIGSEDEIRGDMIYYQYNVKYSQFLNLAQRYAEANSNISYKIIDPNKNPSFISKYASENLTTGDILVESARRYKVLNPQDLFAITSTMAYDANYQPYYEYTYNSTADSAIANALYLTNLENVPLIAVATGHNEMLTSVSSSGGASPISGFYALLEDNNYEVTEFNILTEEIPEGADVVLIPTPTTDYTAEELAKLDAYLSVQDEEFRNVMVTFYPSQGALPNLTGFLQEWGIVPGTEGTVVWETDASKTYGSSSVLFAEYVANDSIRMDTGAYDLLLMPYCVPVYLDDDTADYKSSFVLLQGSATTYASNREEASPETGNTPIAVISQESWTKNNKLYNSSVIAIGNSMMFLNDYVNTSTFSNGDYLIDLFAYATDSSDLASGLVTTKIQTYALDVTASDATLSFFGIGVFTIGIPAVILVAGVVVFLRRRHL